MIGSCTTPCLLQGSVTQQVPTAARLTSIARRSLFSLFTFQIWTLPKVECDKRNSDENRGIGMASSAELHSFFHRLHDGLSSTLDHVIQDAISTILQLQQAQSHRQSPPCLVQDVGDFLVVVLQTLSHIIRLLVRERHFSQHARARFAAQVKKDDLTDLSDAKRMEKKCNAIVCGSPQ